MFSFDTRNYRCPSGHEATLVCTDSTCQSLCFRCPAPCQSCLLNHAGHSEPMEMSAFMLRALQRPNVDPVLLATYDKLVEVLENDPSLENMCDELPDWFVEQLNSQYQMNQLRKCLTSGGQIANPRWFTGKAMCDLLTEVEGYRPIESLSHPSKGTEIDIEAEGEQEQEVQEEQLGQNSLNKRQMKEVIKELKTQSKKMQRIKCRFQEGSKKSKVRLPGQQDKKRARPFELLGSKQGGELQEQNSQK